MPDDERSDADLPIGLRRSKNAAWAGFLLAVTSLLLPWWLVRARQAGQVFDEVAVGVFSPEAPYSHPWLPYLAAALVLVAAGWMFVRIAGRSYLYEPQTWQRDLWVQQALLLVAILSTQFWPGTEVGSFFETARYDNGTVAGLEGFERVALAGLGFWCAVLSLLSLHAAWWLGRGSTRSP